MRGQLLEVAGDVAAGEDAGVDGGVERLDPAVEHLGEPGDVADGAGLDAVLGEMAAGAVGGDQVHAGVAQAAGEVDQPGLVVGAQQRPERHGSLLQAGGQPPDIAVGQSPTALPPTRRLTPTL